MIKVVDKISLSYDSYLYRDTIFLEEAPLLEEAFWDDFFIYQTAFRMAYVDAYGRLHVIGLVKIGQKSMELGRIRLGSKGLDEWIPKIRSNLRKQINPNKFLKPSIPQEGMELDEDSFSLGQDESYYERIKNLGNLVRKSILRKMKDIAFLPELYDEVCNLAVTKFSLMRDITEYMVIRQFRRIAHGDARLTDYGFKYTYPDEEVEIDFKVVPDSNPPTNVHVIIGRNGVGKTTLLKNMLYSIYVLKDSSKFGIFESSYEEIIGQKSEELQAFANVLCVSFSPFDGYSEIKIQNYDMPFTYIGIPHSFDENRVLSNNMSASLSEYLNYEFVKGLGNCIYSYRKVEMLQMAVMQLNSDPILNNIGLNDTFADILDDEKVDENKREEIASVISDIFKELSSGHQFIMLTLVQLVAKLTEKTLVILDEPEKHLHPPLLASFIRALSELLIKYNGVGIISTHSPVILQEVPKKCVWELDRFGGIVKAERPIMETFGSTVGSLTREVFGLEVSRSGFYKMLEAKVQEGKTYEEIKALFNNELGNEALAYLRTLTALNKNGTGEE